MKMEEKYEENLWGQIEILHQKSRRQYASFNYFIEMLNKFHDACHSFTKNIQSIISKKNQIIEFHSTTIYEATDKFVQLFESFLKEFKDAQNTIKTEIIDKIYKPTNELFNNEIKFYDYYNNLLKKYNNSKAKMDKSYKNYINNMKSCENSILNSQQINLMIYAGKEEKEKNLKNALNSIKSTKQVEEKYINSIEQVNKDREAEINYQIEMLKYYQKVDISFYRKIKKGIDVFLVIANKISNSILSSSQVLGESVQKVSIENDIKDYITKNKVEKKLQEISKFIPYMPFSDPTKKHEEAKNLDINFEVIKILKKHFKEIRPDINMEEEEKRKRLRYLCERIFKIGTNISFSKEEKKELLDFLDIPSFKQYFIVALTKQRTKGRFKRSESLVMDLSELLLKILDIAEKEKDYESAKNCIILSQTYYFEENSNDKKKKDNNAKNEPEAEKKYLFHLIKDNKWLTSFEFWDGLVSSNIENEIKKNEENSARQGIEDNENTKQNRLSNICFSQLLTFCTNMIEFGMDKEDADKIVAIYAEKYKISKDFTDTIYANNEMKVNELNEKNKKKSENIANKDINKEKEEKIKDKENMKNKDTSQESQNKEKK